MKIVAAHVLVGIAMVAIALASGNRDFTMIEGLFAAGVIGGQMLLLASWLAFSECSRWRRFLVFTTGVVVLSIISTICVSRGDFKHAHETHAIVAVPVALLTALFCIAKRFVLRPASSTDVTNSSSVFQISTRSLLLITTAVAIAIAIGRLVRSMGGEALGIGVLILSIVVFGSLAMVMLLWAGLGVATPGRRLIGSIVFASLLGTFPPLFIGGPLWRFYTWPILTAFLAIVVGVTLLAVRARGVRLVRVESWLTDALAPTHVAK